MQRMLDGLAGRRRSRGAGALHTGQRTSARCSASDSGGGRPARCRMVLRETAHLGREGAGCSSEGAAHPPVALDNLLHHPCGGRHCQGPSKVAGLACRRLSRRCNQLATGALSRMRGAPEAGGPAQKENCMNALNVQGIHPDPGFAGQTGCSPHGVCVSRFKKRSATGPGHFAAGQRGGAPGRKRQGSCACGRPTAWMRPHGGPAIGSRQGDRNRGRRLRNQRPPWADVIGEIDGTCANSPAASGWARCACPSVMFRHDRVESRAQRVTEAASLSIKSGNACIPRGGSD